MSREQCRKVRHVARLVTPKAGPPGPSPAALTVGSRSHRCRLLVTRSWYLRYAGKTHCHPRARLPTQRPREGESLNKVGCRKLDCRN